MRSKLLAIGFFSLMCCAGQRNKENVSVTELRTKLPTIKTPFTVTTRKFFRSEPVELPNNALLNSVYNKFRKRSLPFTAFGKLYDSENYLIIFGGVATPAGTPILLTFGNNGDQIDSLAIYPNDPGYSIDSTGSFETFHYADIFSDKRIVVVDSTITSQVKMVKGMPEEIAGTERWIVETRKYRVSDKGKIESVD